MIFIPDKIFRNLLQVFYNLRAADIFIILFFIPLSGLVVFYYNIIPHAGIILLSNLLLIVFIMSVTYADLKTGHKFIKQIRYWYVAPFIFLSFKEFYFLVEPIRGIIIDDTLIMIDRFIFMGYNPTELMYKISNPVLTELLQLAYNSFYLLLIILGVNLVITKRYAELNYSVFVIVYGFLLSYAGYLLFPAIGPRFTLHDFANINNALPGLFFTPYLREFVNAGESIPFGTINPASVVQRDAFPSGHTQLTLVVMYLAIKYNIKAKYFLATTGTLLIIATVYLRYHYVIDLIGGIIFMIFTVFSGKYLYLLWENYRIKKLNLSQINFIDNINN